MSYSQRLKERLSKQKACYWGEVASTRLARVGEVVKVPLAELLEWYKADLDGIENDPAMTDSRLLHFVQDYAARHRKKEVGYARSH